MAGKGMLLVLALAIAAGCGGTITDAPRLSRAEYASKADAICREYYRQTDPIDAATFSEVAPALDKLLPILDKALDEVRGLQPPESEQATVDEWLRLSDRVRDDLEEMRNRARANDEEGAIAVDAKGRRDDNRSNKLATQLGMKVCNR
jgi:hypothetical protein